MSWASTATAALAVFLALPYIIRLFADPLGDIPGPWVNKLTSLVHKFYTMTGKKIFYVHDLHEQYGPVVRLGPREVSISDPLAVQEIHKIGNRFKKSGWYLNFANAASPSLFSMVNPDQHAARRKLLSREFSKSMIIKHEIMIKSKIELCVSKIRRDSIAGHADILMWFTYMATDIIGQLCFGSSLDMLEKEKKNEYVHDLETVMILSGIRAEWPTLVKLARLIPIPKLQYVLNGQKRLHGYGRNALELYHSQLEESSQRTVFAQVSAAKSDAMTQYDIEEEATSLIIAGSDTTAVTTTYLVWAILKHPKVKEKLLEEINQLPHDVSAEDVLNAVYLNQVIEEGLRLYGAAPGGLPRRVPRGGRNLAGYYIRRGIVVSSQSYTLHRDGSVFLEPLEFIPERWEKPSQMMKKSFMPFGAGSRVCLGLHLARLEMAMAIVLLFRSCPTIQLAATTTDESMEFENHFLIAPKSHRCEVQMPDT